MEIKKGNILQDYRDGKINLIDYVNNDSQEVNECHDNNNEEFNSYYVISCLNAEQLNILEEEINKLGLIKSTDKRKRIIRPCGFEYMALENFAKSDIDLIKPIIASLSYNDCPILDILCSDGYLGVGCFYYHIKDFSIEELKLIEAEIKRLNIIKPSDNKKKVIRCYEINAISLMNFSQDDLDMLMPFINDLRQKPYSDVKHDIYGDSYCNDKELYYHDGNFNYQLKGLNEKCYKLIKDKANELKIINESDDTKCVIWNNAFNLIILINFSKEDLDKILPFASKVMKRHKIEKKFKVIKKSINKILSNSLFYLYSILFFLCCTFLVLLFTLFTI